MATTTYVFCIEDTSTGLGRTGLTPVWYATAPLYYVSSGVTVPAATRPAISTIGGGWYKFDWDAVTNGEVVGTIDAGVATSPNAYDRYLNVHIGIPAGERADMVVQLLHNARTGPAAGVGVETVYGRDNSTVLANYTRANNGTTQTKTPTGSL